MLVGKVIEETTRSAKEGKIKKEVITEIYIAKNRWELLVAC